MRGREEDYNEFIILQKENADIVISFYEKDDKLECNFIIQNEFMIQRKYFTSIMQKNENLKK